MVAFSFVSGTQTALLLRSRPARCLRYRNGCDFTLRRASASASGAESVAQRHSSERAASSAQRKWRVAGAASAVHALHAAVVYLGPATLLSPMRHSLGLSITEIALPLNVFRVINCILLIPAGVVLDRVGAARMIWPAMVITGVCAGLAPFAQSLLHLTMLQSIFGICFLFGGFTSMLMMVNEAFDEDNSESGAAVGAGIVLAGWSLAGCIAPGIIGLLSTRNGWRFATAVLNSLFICIGLPLTYTYLRRVPVVQSRDKLLASGGNKKRRNLEKEPLFTQRYLATLAALAAMSLSYHVVLDHLPIFMREDLAVPFQESSFILATMNLCGFVSKLAGGWLSERFPVGLLFTVFTILAGLSCLLLIRVTHTGAFVLAASRNAVLVFSLCFGLTYSVVFTLITTALREFGPQRLGLRSNLNLMILFGFGSIGSTIAGASRITQGSYAPSFALSASMWPLILAFVAIYCHRGHALRNER